MLVMKWLTMDLQMFKREPKQQQQNFITDKINSYMHFTVKPGNRMRVSLGLSWPHSSQ